MRTDCEASALPLGVYIHIPFCRRKCLYCDFASGAGTGADMDAYLLALRSQLQRVLPAGAAVDTVYIGGGTPSVFGAVRLTALLEALHAQVRLLPEAEVTCEVNPESASGEVLTALRRGGVNRISMGVQSADDRELRRIGRLHDFAQASAAVERIRAAGFQNLSLDLMLGLPGQTEESLAHSLERVLALSPQHLSCYMLKLEAGTPLFESPPPDLPDDDRTADLYLQTLDCLQKQGYRQYEISNFCLPDFASRHNLRYWRLRPYIGLGCAAHSCVGARRWANLRDRAAFVAAIGRGEDAMESEEWRDEREIARERAMLGLRLTAGVALCGVLQPVAARLEKYRAAGFAERRGDIWRLTPKGMLVSNAILADVLDGV